MSATANTLSELSFSSLNTLRILFRDVCNDPAMTAGVSDFACTLYEQVNEEIMTRPSEDPTDALIKFIALYEDVTDDPCTRAAVADGQRVLGVAA